MKYIYHLLKHIKSFMFHPIESTRWLLSDLKKDINASNYDSKMKSVWCAGLPKSGTSLIEEIFDEMTNLTEKIMDSELLQLFPYSSKDNKSVQTLEEIRESVKNLNTRLSNLKKINKSLNEFEDNNSSFSWNELRNLTSEVHKYREE